MNALQRSKLSMSMATRDYLLQNVAITAPLPNVAANVTILQNTILQIQAIAEVQDFAKQGVADSKGQLRSTLCTLSADTSRKLVAYAKFNNNVVLLKEIKYRESELLRIADIDLKTKAQEIYDRAQANVTALAAYGITAASQTALLTAINAFNVSIPKPRLGIDERKQATQQLVVLFTTLETALDIIDTSVEIIRLTQVNFYNGYKTARKIILNGSSLLSVKGNVTDAISGEPVKGVSVLFTLSDSATLKSAALKKSEPVLTKTTADKGGFNIKLLPAGTYNVTFNKVGYAEQVLTVYINDGEMSEVNVALMAS